MTEPEGEAATVVDPTIAPHLARIEAALGYDSIDPAALLTEIEGALGGIRAARAPGIRTRRITDAEKALRAAAAALRAKPGAEALTAMRAAAELHRKAHGLPPAKAPRRRFGFAAALEDRPPPKSVCRKLEWEVGRPPMLIGPPGAGKTFVVQAAALDLIGGRPLWGCPDFQTHGCSRVLHVDLDQGANKTLRRFKRLLRGLGVDAAIEGEARAQLGKRYQMDPRDIETFDVDEGEGLRLLSLDPAELARWRSALVDAVKGYDVAFVDSLRRLAPFLDENDSRFSIVPDMMREVSEAAQCVIVLLHHASNKAPAHRGPKPAAGTRGSSAIDGAAGTQLLIEEDGDARRVTQSRAGEAAKLPAFYLAFQDDDQRGPGGIRGLRIIYQTPEQAHAPETAEKSAKLRAAAEKAIEYIRKINLVENYGPTRKQIVAEVQGCRDKDLWVVLDMMVKDGRATEEKDGRTVRLWVTRGSAA